MKRLCRYLPLCGRERNGGGLKTSRKPPNRNSKPLKTNQIFSAESGTKKRGQKMSANGGKKTKKWMKRELNPAKQ